MIIFAIDPGNVKSAYVVWRSETKQIAKGIMKNEELLKHIKTGNMYGTVDLAVEMIASYGMAVGEEVFETCLWIGRFIEAWENRTGREAQLITRMKVKMNLCHSPKAKDANIRQAIIDRFGGTDIAIGNKKCPVCKGKGWTGREHLPCKECGGSGWKYPPGTLATVRADEWAALAVALTVVDAKLS